MMNQEVLEMLHEQIGDAINILQLLIIELEANGDDKHIRRSVSIVEKILQAAIHSLEQLQGLV